MAPGNLGLGGLFLLGFLTLCNTQEREILQNPDSVTVYLNQSAVFNCETRGGTSSWKVNGISIDNLPSGIDDDFTDSLTKTENKSVLTLTVQAKEQYNETIIQCGIVWYGGSVNSTNSTLLIQGQLSAVGDLRATNRPVSVTISWSAPFSLDVTGVDPDIWYSVLIYNVTDENNPTTLSIKVNDTSYTFAPPDINPCDEYLVSVTPMNGAPGHEESRAYITIEPPCDEPAIISRTSTTKHPEPSVISPETGGGRGYSQTDLTSPGAIAGWVFLSSALTMVLVIFIVTISCMKRKSSHGDEAHEMEPRVTTCTEPSVSTRRTVSTTRNYVKDEERHLLNSRNSATVSSSLPEGEERGGFSVVDDPRPELAVVPSSSHPPQYQRQEVPGAVTPPEDTHNGVPLSASKSLEKEPEEKEPGAPTVESVMSLLMNVTGRWEVIAEGLRFDEDLIEGIKSRNTTDEARLEDCVEKWVNRSRPGQSSWEDLTSVLIGLGEDKLAQQACSGGKQETHVGGCERDLQTGQAESEKGSGASQMVAEYKKLPTTDDKHEGTRGSKSSMSFTDSTGIGARSFLPELPHLVKSFQNDDESESDDIIDSKGKEENGHPGISSFSVTCTQESSENTKTTKFALGDEDHDVSSLKKAGCTPTLVKPLLPLKGLSDAAVLTNEADKALELSKPTPTDGAQVTEGERKALKPRQKTRGPSTSRKSNRKKRKKRGSLSPPANKRGPGHECETHDHSHPRTKTRKSCGNLPQD